MTIRILLADDHNLMREGIRSVIASQPNMTVVGEADNGRAAVQLAQSLSPDIVIMDVSMQGLNGVEATRRIKETTPGVKILALSIHLKRSVVVDMLSVGASGYLLKDCLSEDLISAIRAVASNSTYLSPQVADIVLKDYLHRVSQGEAAPVPMLSSREREVLQFLAEGKRPKDIASTLELGVKTVEYHKQQIMTKLNIHSIAGLTKYAIQEGLLILDQES